MQFQPFDKPQIFLNPTDPRRVYFRRTDEKKTSVPWGQRKLLLVELAFFSLFWDPIQVPKPQIVYAGAAPGNHIEQLSIMFPEMTFHLWDPRPFQLAPSAQINIHQEYFTEEVAEQWKGRNDVYFISDIRTADYKDLDAEENERQITRDMYRQQDWHIIIKPVASLLKFRLPYSGVNQPMTLPYLDGILLKQPWAPQTSTESRLVVVGEQIKEWDCLAYEEQMFYFNTIVRETVQYYNLFDCSIQPIDSPELLNDFDSMAEVYVLGCYLRLRKVEPNKFLVATLSGVMTDSINKGKKFRDTIAALRANTRLIKERNAHKNNKKYLHVKFAKESSRGKTSKIFKRQKNLQP